MYSVGQVLYVILAKKSQVYPMQVVEVITKKTLNGEVISYVLQAGPNKETVVTLDKVDGEVYNTAQDAKNVLIERATSQISRIVENAVSKSAEWYHVIENMPQTIQDLPDLSTKYAQQSQEIDIEIEDATSVKLPDGTIVKVKLPEIYSNLG